MVPTLTSRSSKETSEWRGAPPTVSALSCLVLMILNGLLKIRVTERQQRALLQIKSKKAEPQSTKGNRQYQVEPRRHRALSEFRPGHPEKIHETHEYQPHGDFGNNLGSAFQVLREQQEKGNKEVEDDDDHGDHAPSAIQPRAIEANLFGLVAGPDDEQLGEIEIGPKHHKCE